MRYSYFAGNARLDWRSRRRRAECIGAGAGDWDVDGDGRPWHSTRLPHDACSPGRRGPAELYDPTPGRGRTPAASPVHAGMLRRPCCRMGWYFIVEIGGGINLEPSKFAIRQQTSSPSLTKLNEIAKVVQPQWTHTGDAES